MLPLSLKPSRHCTAGLALLHAGALLSLLFSTAPLLLIFAGSLFCLYSARHTICTYARLSNPQAIVECQWIEKNIWLLKDRQSREYTASLLGSSWRSRLLLILNFHLVIKPAKKRPLLAVLSATRTVILVGDMLEPDAFRRVQVHLTVGNI